MINPPYKLSKDYGRLCELVKEENAILGYQLKNGIKHPATFKSFTDVRDSV